MNLFEIYPLLSKQDKTQVARELKGKTVDQLIELIILLFAETQRQTSLTPKQQQQQEQKGQDELCYKYQALFQDHQGLFQKYQNLLNDHKKVVDNFQSIIEKFKEQTFLEFIKTIQNKEEVLNTCKNLKFHIEYEQEYQDEIQKINQEFEDIQQQGQQLVSSIKQLNDYDKGTLVPKQVQIITEAQKQIRNEKITSLQLQIKQFQEQQKLQIDKLAQLQQRLPDGNLNKHIDHTLRLLQLNYCIFQKVQCILPSQFKLIEQYEQKLDNFQNQFLQEQKIKDQYFRKMEEYKKSYEKLIQGNGGNFLTFKESQPSQYTKLLQTCYRIYLQYLTLILNLIESQKVQLPQLQQDIQGVKSELNKKFGDFQQLIEFTEQLQANVMVLANYIQKDNKMDEILYSWSQFFKTYSELLKGIPK